jgi:hypothetical protein
MCSASLCLCDRTPSPPGFESPDSLGRSRCFFYKIMSTGASACWSHFFYVIEPIVDVTTDKLSIYRGTSVHQSTDQKNDHIISQSQRSDQGSKTQYIKENTAIQWLSSSISHGRLLGIHNKHNSWTASTYCCKKITYAHVDAYNHGANITSIWCIRVYRWSNKINRWSLELHVCPLPKNSP